MIKRVLLPGESALSLMDKGVVLSFAMPVGVGGGYFQPAIPDGQRVCSENCAAVHTFLFSYSAGVCSVCRKNIGVQRLESIEDGRVF